MWWVRASLVIATSLLGIGPHAMPLDASAATSASGPQDVLHQVMPGDDLRLIAGYYYGDTRQWERIWQANREQVPKPNRIERGAFLRIPDVKAPAEPYVDFVARARGPAAPPAVQTKADLAPPPEVPTSPVTPGAPAPSPPRPQKTTALPPTPAAPGPTAAPARPPAAPPPPAKRP